MWSSGDQIVLRFLVGERIAFARPVTVVEDSGERVALFLAAGTPTKSRVLLDGTPIPRDLSYADRFARPWRLGDGTWGPNDLLLVTPPDAAHSIWLFWGQRWEMLGWYVNLQAPLVRTPVGFDTSDHVLDLWVEADGTWTWKDEDELEDAVRVGRFTAEEAAAIRAEGERVLRAWPFPTGWEDWRPDDTWPTPRFPEGWDTV